MVAALSPIEAARLAYDRAKAATNAARTAAYALDWGAPGEDEAWQLLERCQAVETARSQDLDAAIDGDREQRTHTDIIPQLSPNANNVTGVAR